MKKAIALLALSFLVAIPTLADKLTGYVSDQQCAANASKAAKASDWIHPKVFETCAQKCAKEGSPVIFLTEDNKIVKLDAASLKKASALLGHRVSVTGKIENGTLKIDAITTIPFEAQTDPNNHQEERIHQ